MHIKTTDSDLWRFSTKGYTNNSSSIPTMRFHILLGASLLFGFISLSSSQTTQAAKETLCMKRLLNSFWGEIMRDVFSTSDRGGHSDQPDDVHFFLYTNQNDPNDYDTLHFHDDDSIRNARWIPGAKVVVLAHGFTQSQNSSMPGVIKNAYLERAKAGGKQVNVVVVDWGQLAFALADTTFPMYLSAVNNVDTAGIRTGHMMVKFIDLNIVKSPLDIHLIGFSLGAHVMGQAGHTFQKMKPALPKIGQITGLDPAGPLFYAKIQNFNGKQLSKSDAEYVDIIHTSWGSYGIAATIGHSDFFPNRGPNVFLQTQPICVNPLDNQKPLQVCSHNMAPVYFAMTILLPEMGACGCDSYASWKIPFIGCNAKCQSSKSAIPWGENLDTATSFGSYYMAIPEGSFLSSPSPSNTAVPYDSNEHQTNEFKRRKPEEHHQLLRQPYQSHHVAGDDYKRIRYVGITHGAIRNGHKKRSHKKKPKRSRSHRKSE